MNIRAFVRGAAGSPASLLLGAALGAATFWAVDSGPSSAASVEAQQVLRSDAVSRVARARARSVVLLHSISGKDSPPAGVSQREWLVRPVEESLGSGIVLDDRGLILTNAHVIERGGVVHVRRPDGEDLETTLVGIDTETDLALLRVSDPTGLAPAPLGDSDQLDVGSFVVAIGNPLGLHHTVTAGVVSAKARDLDNSGIEFLQTDAAVNPGSSGGPLLDLSGRVVGVITALASQAGENIGLNFAIPINAVKEVLPALRANSVTHAWLGFATAVLSPAGARAFGLTQPGDGLLVTAVESTGPAARAGIEPRDVLLGMAGSPPVRATDVYRRIRTMTPGTTVRLKILRDGRRLELPVVLGTRPRD